MSPPPANGPGTRKSKGMDSPATLKRDSHMPPRTRRAISKTQKIPRGNTPFAGLQGDDAGPSAIERAHGRRGAPTTSQAMRRGPFGDAGRLRRESAVPPQRKEQPRNAERPAGGTSPAGLSRRA